MTCKPKTKATIAAKPKSAIDQATTTTPPAILPALAHFDDLPDAAHVRLPVVAALLGISAPTVWRWVKSGRLPAPSKLGPNTTAWRVGSLRQARPAGA